MTKLTITTQYHRWQVWKDARQLFEATSEEAAQAFIKGYEAHNCTSEIYLAVSTLENTEPNPDKENIKLLKTQKEFYIPIYVEIVNRRFKIVDGNHRHLAARERGQELILARILL